MTPRFIRIYNEDIFTADSSIFSNTYVQICISTSNISKLRYIEQLKNIKMEYPDCNIRIHTIDDSIDINTLNVSGFNTNINQYIETNIPDHLESKYKIIKEKINEQK